MGGIKEEPPTDGEEYSSEHEISENSEGTSERLFILSNRAFLTPAQYMKCLEKVEEIKFKALLCFYHEQDHSVAA
ncbi:B3 domain-containing protein [Hordeum vulgare]|nr:B3 domain-containing protein [Hordeum vulgare]